MNDPLEYKWSQDSLRKLDKDTGGFDKYTKRIIGNLNKNTAPFIVSLSGAEDDLPQWKTYGGNGYGYAIRFKVDALLSEAAATVKSAKDKYYLADGAPRVLGDAGDVVGLNQVYYVSEDEQAQIVRNIFELTKTRLHSDLEIQIANTLAVSKVSPWIKRQGYASEHEFRLVLQDLQPAPMSSKVANYLPVGTHIKGNIFVPHVELHIPSSVDKVMIGPSLRGYKELAKIGLRELLDQSICGKVVLNSSVHQYQG
ncbi:DUF2971 domain-containing protein [Kocuria sabuli]|uniref:DUF2971 domain-containing protein n=1 Tax=Kocuria sabuli TaxID=3071448 RepID=UPI0034D48EAF